MDPFAQLKASQREGWALFAPLATFTAPPAARLIDFAQVRAEQSVLDVATGTGVVAITARRQGARVTGLDLTPALLEHARANAAVAELKDVQWIEGDVEALPFPDAAFDVVLSQFGHIFAPRPEVATREMLRVLRPGGRIAFSTWSPEHLVGQIFAFAAQHLPPPPGLAPPGQWGVPEVIVERLGAAVESILFDRGVMKVPALSPQHFRDTLERTAPPIIGIMKQHEGSPDRQAALRRELEALVAPYFAKNQMRQHYLLTRAIKR